RPGFLGHVLIETSSMSGFVGIFDLEGRLVDEALLERLASPIAYRGSLTRSLTVPGFGIQVLSHTDPSIRLGRRGDVLLAFAGRLDDPEQLPHGAPNSCAAEIALDEFERGGTFPSRLIGDFSISFFDLMKA